MTGAFGSHLQHWAQKQISLISECPRKDAPGVACGVYYRICVSRSALPKANKISRGIRTCRRDRRHSVGGGIFLYEPLGGGN
jgi:hypothetical protein